MKNDFGYYGGFPGGGPRHETHEAAFASLIEAKGNDYHRNPDGAVYFKTAPDTFGDGPYFVIEMQYTDKNNQPAKWYFVGQ